MSTHHNTIPIPHESFNLKGIATEISGDAAAIESSKQLAEYLLFGDKGNEQNTSPRNVQREKFIDANRGRIAHSAFDYPELDKNTEDIIDIALRTKMMRFLLEFEIAKQNNHELENQDELELTADYCEVALKKMALVETAQHMRHAAASEDYEIARNKFKEICKDLFGEVDEDTSASMLATEYDKLAKLDDSDRKTLEIVTYLRTNIFNKVDIASAQSENPMLSAEAIRKAKEVIDNRYADLYSVVPDTDDSGIYNANECQKIINEAFQTVGLPGWKCVIGEVTSPNTNVDTKTITISPNEKRTAKQLRCLLLHEVEVHARRGQNGIDSGYGVLKKGTADYGDVEEGLGVLLESIHSGDPNSPALNRARDRYIVASLIEGTNGSEPMDGQETFETTWRMLAVRMAGDDGKITNEMITRAKTESMKHIENAFRATSFRDRGLMYSKLITYYVGLTKNAKWISGATDINEALDAAMLGKYNHTNPDEVERVRNMVSK